MEDEDDDMAALSQDPGYALYMLQLEIEHMGDMIHKEHSYSLEEYLSKQEFEEEIRRDEAYYSELEDEENGE